VEVGEGPEIFRPLVDEESTLELVFGPQGGFHVDVAARLWNVNPDQVDIEYSLVLDSVSRTVHYPARYNLSLMAVEVMEDYYLRLGDRIFFLKGPASDIVGKPGTLQVRLLEGGIANRDTEDGDVELAVSMHRIMLVENVP
jgi:hypothetical protein